MIRTVSSSKLSSAAVGSTYEGSILDAGHRTDVRAPALCARLAGFTVLKHVVYDSLLATVSSVSGMQMQSVQK